MMFLVKLQRSTGLIITVLVVVGCGTLIATRSGTNNKESGLSEIESVAPTSPPSLSPSPSPSKPKPKPRPSSQHVEQTMPARVLAFEAAYLIVDPVKRLSALKPYVAPRFGAVFPKQIGSSPAEKAAAELTYTLDRGSSCDMYLMDSTTMYVTSTLKVTSHADGIVANTYQLRHETIWVKIKGQWYVTTAGQAEKTAVKGIRTIG